MPSLRHTQRNSIPILRHPYYAGRIRCAHLSSYGGNAVICPNKEDYILCDSIAHWGRACKCHIDESLCKNPDGPADQFTYERLGINVEMSELNACFGRWQLQRWQHYELRRRENYRLLYDMLKDNPNLKLWEVGEEQPSRFVFPIKLINGMTVRDAWEILSPKGVEIRTLMGGATCSQPAFRDLVEFGAQTNAIGMADTTFFIGIHQTLSAHDVKAVARIINDTFR
ncbi:MAG: DegT/DnrJ/EryC1/StrS family aminotransferase [Muribaculaceae bacterium]|nr:DegT/DnrJ/EryC1/StrS family aminotransferase [Muribaculaceae bacterium]